MYKDVDKSLALLMIFVLPYLNLIIQVDWILPSSS